MAIFVAECGNCGEVEVKPNEHELQIDERTHESWWAFQCPNDNCGAIGRLAISSDVADELNRGYRVPTERFYPDSSLGGDGSHADFARLLPMILGEQPGSADIRDPYAPLGYDT